MGKKGWFSAVKKVVHSSYLKKIKKEKRSHKSRSPRKSCHRNQISLDSCLSQTQAQLASPPRHYPPIEVPEPKQPENEQQIEETYSTTFLIVPEQPENQKIEQTYSTASPTAMAEEEEAEDTSSQADDEVNYMAPSPSFLSKSKEEFAAIRIQSAYRGYLAREAVKPLRAARRLKLLVQGQAAKRQTESTLMRLQTMARVQSQVQNRKIQMSEVNEALRRQQLQRREKNAKSSEGAWDLSPRSKEQVEASLRRKKEAAERREKALAYSQARQQTWRKSLKSASSDPNGTYWGWSWSERWEAVRPWETEPTTNGESVSCQSPSTPPSKALSPRLKPASPKRTADNGPKSLSNTRATKTMKVSSEVMQLGPSPLGSGKKGVSNAGSRVGSPKKGIVSLNSSPSGGKRSLAPLRTSISARG